MPTPPVVSKVLVANRGEIAVRIMRTLASMNIDAVAVHSRLDAGALHVRVAPLAVSLAEVAEPGDATGGYLSIDALVGVAVNHGCDAVHPGYGFLAENADFARACATAGLTFIGPGPAAIEALGDKAAARAIAVRAAVPVVPGIELADDASAAVAAAGIGYPVLIKPIAGGGGKGMHVAVDDASLAEALPRARREAAAAFGDDRLLLERFLPKARHIEVQVLADSAGTVRAIGDRECTLQRRHQKVIEEAPAPNLSDDVRARIHSAAEAVVREVGYTNAGTVEFVVSAEDDREFYFLEVNTRLQVEHPVTEEVLGIDLVQCQVRVARGESLQDLEIPSSATGSSFEARVYAEDADNGFLPTGGRLSMWQVPPTAGEVGARVRVDAAVEAGDGVSSAYDPMIAKVITWAPNRAAARTALADVLGRTCAFGLVTNTAFLVDLLNAEPVAQGNMDTRFIERFVEQRRTAELEPTLVAVWAATIRRFAEEAASTAVGSAWRARDSWQLNAPRPLVVRGNVAGVDIRAELQPTTGVAGGEHLGGISVAVSIGDVSSTHSVAATGGSDGSFHAVIDGQHVGWTAAVVNDVDGQHTWLHINGRTWVVDLPRPLRGSEASGSADSVVRSPMPGTVVRVSVAVGDSVEAGAHLLSVEAMKMEHALTSPHAGVVSAVSCDVGAHVKLREVLVVVEPRS